MLRKVFYFTSLSNLDRLSTNQVPIKPDRKFTLKAFKILTDRKLVSINQKTDSTDRAPIEDQLNQAETKLINSRDFRSVKKHIQFIKILENWIF